LFPEYEVVITRETDQISIITGRKVFETMALCDKSAAIVKGWVADKFPALEYSDEQPNYSSDKENVFVNVGCSYTDDDPYPTLELQIRGKKQDTKLKEAWGRFFEKKR
jgi:hypothetical protein